MLPSSFFSGGGGRRGFETAQDSVLVGVSVRILYPNSVRNASLVTGRYLGGMDEICRYLFALCRMCLSNVKRLAMLKVQVVRDTLP